MKRPENGIEEEKKAVCDGVLRSIRREEDNTAVTSQARLWTCQNS